MYRVVGKFTTSGDGAFKLRLRRYPAVECDTATPPFSLAGAHISSAEKVKL